MGVVFEQPLKPPTSVLLLCFLLFVCSTLIMAIYIQHAHNVPNPEISRTWEKFLHGLSGMELCARTPGVNLPGFDPAAQFSDLIGPAPGSTRGRAEMSITVNASIRLVEELTRLPPGTVALTGQVRLGEWARLCYKSEEEEETMVNISFVVPENMTQASPREVCVILSGSSAILPLSRPSAICVPPLITINTTKLGQLTSRAEQTIFNTMTKNKDQCDNGSLLQLTYNSQADLVIYLSKLERERITWNLQVVSGCLLLAGVICVAYRLIVTRRSILVNDEGYAASQLT